MNSVSQCAKTCTWLQNKIQFADTSQLQLTGLLAASCWEICCDCKRDLICDGSGLFFEMTRLMLYSVHRTVRASRPLTKYVAFLLLKCLASMRCLWLPLNLDILIPQLYNAGPQRRTLTLKQSTLCCAQTAADLTASARCGKIAQTTKPKKSSHTAVRYEFQRLGWRDAGLQPPACE